MPGKEDIEFKVKFECDPSEMDADTLISSLIGLSSAIQEINIELQPEKKIEIKIKSLKEGSFLVHLHLISTYIGDLLNSLLSQDVLKIAAIVTILAGILNIKKHLEGDKPQSVNEEDEFTVIENNKGNIIKIDNRTYNIYAKNRAIDSALSRSFDTLSKDDTIKGIELIGHDNGILFNASENDIECMALAGSGFDIDKRSRIEIVELNIFKIVFQEKYKWEFYHHGNRISAKLMDEKFYKIIDDGEAFAKGDILVVELQTNQVFDKSVNTYINKSYQINKVIKHIPRAGQGQLDLS